MLSRLGQSVRHLSDVRTGGEWVERAMHAPEWPYWGFSPSTEKCGNMRLKVDAGTPSPLAPAAARHTRQTEAHVAAWRVLPRAAKVTLAAGTAVTPPTIKGTVKVLPECNQCWQPAPKP